MKRLNRNASDTKKALENPGLGMERETELEPATFSLGTGIVTDVTRKIF